MGVSEMVTSYIPRFPPKATEKQEEAKEKATKYLTDVTTTYNKNTLDQSKPTIGTGQIIPYLLGKEVCRNPLLLWYGNVDMTYDLEIVKTVEDNGDGTIITHYNYVYTPKSYVADFQLGLALGPGVVLRGIYFKGVKVWSGSNSGGTFNIGQNISPISEVIFHGGSFDQSRDPYLEASSNEGGDTPTPGYVGVAYVILKSITMDQIGSMAFEVERFPNPLGLTTALNRKNDDINVATAIADIITNDWGGCGQDLSTIDISNFVNVAQVLAAEGNFCSLINSSIVSGTNLLKPLLDQCRGVLFINPELDKFQMRLARFPLDRTGALRLYDNDTINLDELQKEAWSSVPSGIKVEYVERNYNYSTIPIIGKNLASNGTNTSLTLVSMPTVKSKELATAIMSREMSLAAAPVQNVRGTFNRKAADVMPGDVVVITSSKYKYYSVPMLVSKRRTQPIDNNTVSLTGDIFFYAGNNVLFAEPEDTLFEGVDTKAYPPDNVTLLDLPLYFNPDTQWGNIMLDASGGEVFGPLTDFTPPRGNYPYFATERHNKRQYGFTATWGDNAGSAYPFPRADIPTKASLDYSTVGKLGSRIDKYDAWDGSSITIEIQNLVYYDPNLDPNNPSSPAKFGFIIIGDEIFWFGMLGASTSSRPIPGESTWTYTKADNKLVITGCYRAMFDSVAQDHEVGDKVFIIRDDTMSPLVGAAEIRTNRSSLPVTGNLPHDINFIGQAIVYGQVANSEPYVFNKANYTANDRYKLPYKPRNTKIDGERLATPKQLQLGSSVTVSWIPNARQITYTQVIALPVVRKTTAPPLTQTDPSIPPWYADGKMELDVNEMAPAYRVWIEDSGGNTYDCGVTAPSANPVDHLTITIPTASLGLGWLWVETEFQQKIGLLSTSSELVKSKYKDKLPIELIP
jgi:hypothetical protein